MPGTWEILALILAVAALAVALWVASDAKVGPFAEKTK